MDPGQISRWLESNLWRLDGPEAFLGDEPGSARKSWDQAQVRMLLAASWPYLQAAGNNSIPVVYRSVNEGGNYLCDRYYLPATPRDFKLLEKGGVPTFGIESRHSVRDFDIFATSISYTVLFVNFAQYLRVSGIPLRWRDRQQNPGDYPMVMVGGQAWCAPEFMAPAVDCVFLGEAEDAPGNPGIAAVCARVAEFKASGAWRYDREDCYRQLALAFNFLYFPRYLDVEYGTTGQSIYITESTETTAGPSKFVTGYRVTLPGLQFPFKKRYVKELDSVAPHTEAPLLYSDPGMGCPVSDSMVLTHDGPRFMHQLRREQQAGAHPLLLSVGDKGLHTAAAIYPEETRRGIVEVLTESGHAFRGTADHLIQAVEGPLENVQGRRSRKVPLGPRQFDQTRDRHETFDQLPRCWVEADLLEPGRHFIPVYYGQDLWAGEYVQLDTACPYQAEQAGTGRFQLREVRLPSVLDERLGYFLGLFVSDGVYQKNSSGSNGMGVHVQEDQPELGAEVSGLLASLFPGARLVVARGGHELWRGERISVTSRQITWWLERNFGVTDLESRRRHVFDAILRSPRTVVAEFLSGVFDANGDVSVARSRGQLIRRPPKVSSGRFREFAEEVALLCCNLGAPAVVRQEEREPHGFASRSSVSFRVALLASTDGEYTWLASRVEAKRSRVEAWLRETLPGTRTGHMNRDGVFYTPVRSVVRSTDPARCGDVRVPGVSSYTCGGIIVHNSGDIEAAKGCPAWCSFCRLTYVDKPYREHSVDYLVSQAKEWRRNMGSNELSPYGPDFPMYVRKKELLSRLMEEVSDEVDTGAMRVDDFISDDDYSMLLAFGGTDAVTLGLEGNSQRMRDLIGKGVSDSDVEEAVTRAIRAGIRKVKLFMISNMPGEESGDVMRIVRLGQRLAQLREELGQPGVRIQFSWTPLLIEAQTPMQWFAPTPPDYTLQQAMAELREQRIEMKLGSKAQAEKIALFQACQRASRDAGEAIVDVIEELGTGSWGGVAKDMKERLDAALVRHGFRNGLDDLFQELGHDDLLGWEHISTGVSKELMWGAYRHMVEFLEGTDAGSYDEQFDEQYRGAEWIARCDQHCAGRACGCCDKKDLEIRQDYIKAVDRDLDQYPVQPLDQTTVACKVRFRYERGDAHRFVSNAHWKFAIRRAAYRAQEDVPGFPYIAKRSVRVASDAYKYRDRSSGIDYGEFGLTRMVLPGELSLFMERLAAELAPWLEVGEHTLLEARAALQATPVSFWELEVADGEEALSSALRAYGEKDYVRILLKSESFYSGQQAEEANAKDHIADAWLARDRDRLLLRMILNGKLGPYQAYAPLAGKAGWVEAMRYTARRLAFFDAADPLQGSLLRPVCEGCGAAVPAGLLGEVFDMDYCPRCKDEAAGIVVSGLSRAY